MFIFMTSLRINAFHRVGQDQIGWKEGFMSMHSPLGCGRDKEITVLY